MINDGYWMGDDLKDQGEGRKEKEETTGRVTCVFIPIESAEDKGDSVIVMALSGLGHRVVVALRYNLDSPLGFFKLRAEW